MDTDLIIGVDGGGTHSRLAAVREDGTVVAIGPGGGINYNTIGMRVARERLFDAVEALLGECGETRYRALSIGMSALDGAADERLIKEFAADRFDPNKIKMNSDVYMALMGATMGGCGVMVVSGTGAMIVAMDERGNVHNCGGWGYLLDDPGSAYGVAIQALKAVMAGWEGSIPPTLLTEHALNFFQADGKRELLEKLYADESDPSRIAQFAREVLTCAKLGDKAARDIVEGNVAYLVRQTNRMLGLCGEKVGVSLYGGMFAHNEWIRSMFCRQLKELSPFTTVSMLKFPPELGAVVAYMKQAGRLNEDIVDKMKKTWERIAYDSCRTVLQ